MQLEYSELTFGGNGKRGSKEMMTILSDKLNTSLNALNTSYIDMMLYHDASDESLLFHPATQKFFDDMKSAGTIKAMGFSTHNDCMNLIARNNREGFYDIIMVPFNHKGAYTHSVNGSFSEWEQDKLIGLLTEASEKGKGIVVMKTCSGGPFSPEPGRSPNYYEPVKWVLQHKFISAAAVAMASFEQVDEHLPLLIK
jgi:hypothetical protein